MLPEKFGFIKKNAIYKKKKFQFIYKEKFRDVTKLKIHSIIIIRKKHNQGLKESNNIAA